MGVIVDTCIWVDIERGRLAPDAVADLIGNDAVYVAPPVIAELRYGVQRARTPEQRARRESALARIRRKPCLIIDVDTGDLFGQISAELDARGTPSAFRVQDLWLAALALQHRFRLLTENGADLRGIPGLEVVVVPAP